MKPSSQSIRAGFTLLELVVVLAILAITTGLAVRALDRVEDQRRFESAQRGFQELSEAVLGSPDDRNIDGTRTISGFVADMGRLPRATAEEWPNGEVFTLRELWNNPGAPYEYDIRPATEAHGVPSAFVDEQVLVPGGWRGPYLRLPIGAETLLDAWGNPMISPDPTGYARLGSTLETPITAAGQEIRVIRHLGANGRPDDTDVGYNRDETLAFRGEQFQAGLTVQIEVLDGTSRATPDSSMNVVLRVFGPHPDNPNLILVSSPNESTKFEANPVVCTVPKTVGVTAGPRIVRAYLYSGDDADTDTKLLPKSSVKQVTLRPGMNFLQLTIDR